MEVFTRFLSGHANVHTQLWDHLRQKTFAALDEHTREKAALKSPAAVRARGEKIRETFLESLGGLPASGHPLNARVVGRVPRKGYVIEKVIFESEPKVYVTALFYLPKNRVGRVPGILFVSGHHQDAKAAPEYQRVCHDLATNGFAVLATDPTGQGERLSYVNPASGKDPVGWGTSEHSYQGQQCILTGTSIARYFLFDALRGVDYLQSRPEVDPERIGATGNSGGGTQTTLLCMSGDPRIKAAVPCTYVTSREHYYLTGQAQDAEQVQFGMTRDGINFDDMFLPFAPRPLLIGAVESDFFSPEGTALTYERLRRLYSLLHAEDKVACVVAPGGHRYCKELREAAVNWFGRHLQGFDRTFVSQDDALIETLPPESLWCTAKGQVSSEFSEARSPYHRNLASIPVRAASRSSEELRTAMMEALCIRERMESPQPLFPSEVRTQEIDGLTAKSIFFISEPGIMVSACLVHRTGPAPDEAVIVLTPDGTHDMTASESIWRGIAESGRAAFVFDVRGTGSVQADPISGYPSEYPSTFFNTDNWLAFCAYCVGDSLFGMRAYDVLRAAAYLRGSAGFTQLGLRASGFAPALWGYVAAALETSIRETEIDDLLESYEALVRAPLYRKDFTPSLLVHGVLQSFDLPELQVLFEGRKVARVAVSAAMV